MDDKMNPLCPSEELGGWQVVLLVDSNERSNPTVKSMPRDQIVLNMNKTFGGGNPNDSSNADTVHCESRRLLAGDYLWIARKPGVSEERVLDCIIERKTCSDLVSSLMTKSTSFAPLYRMQVQMKKMQSTTISQKIILLENDKGKTGSFISGLRRSSAFQSAGAISKAVTFTQEVKQGEHYGFTCQETTCVNDTVRFLNDQHETMRRQVRDAYQQALAKTTMSKDASSGATTTSISSVDEEMIKLPPFAPVETIERVNELIEQGLQDPSFLYYLELRRVFKMGEAKAELIMEHFPTQQALEDCANSPTCIHTLSNLDIMGKAMAEKIWHRFATNPQPQETPAKTRKRKQPPTVVTPDSKQGRLGKGSTSDTLAEKPCRARSTGSKIVENHPSAQRRLFDASGPCVEHPNRDHASTSDSIDLEGKVKHAASSGKRKPRKLFQKNKAKDDYDFLASSSDDDSLFEPIFGAKPCPIALPKTVEGKPSRPDKSQNSESSSDDGSLFEPIFGTRPSPRASANASTGKSCHPSRRRKSSKKQSTDKDNETAVDVVPTVLLERLAPRSQGKSHRMRKSLK